MLNKVYSPFLQLSLTSYFRIENKVVVGVAFYLADLSRLHVLFIANEAQFWRLSARPAIFRSHVVTAYNLREMDKLLFS